MGKQANIQRIEQFRRDVALLKKKYPTLKEIAAKIPCNASNFSRYVKGSKSPGESLINRFYAIYEEELKLLANKFNISDKLPSSTADEQPIIYPSIDDKTDHIQTLKSNNKALHGYLGTLIKNNQYSIQQSETRGCTVIAY